jgi:gamma-glutamylcyclotransferase (GGCT)/AIG2-like uncharacterized protein YtfP
MSDVKFNLFIYGSLRAPEIFKSVSGLSFTFDRSEVNDKAFFAEPALLSNYRKVSPDNVYFYAVANNSSKIEGFVIYDVPSQVMAEIDRYEGKRYDRETVRVNTAKGFVDAMAYLASYKSMKKRFGDRFHVNLIHELWLRKRIEEFIKKRTRPGDQTADAELERRADRELLATTERDLVISHYRADAVSDFYLEHELNRPRPSIKHLYNDEQAKPFIENYLAMVVKQVLINQLDEKIQSQYRFELDHIRTSERYFKRSVSLLMSLQMVNANSPTVDLIISQCLATMPYEKYDLIDYVKYAVGAAESIFDLRVARSQLDRIRLNFDPGLVPIGAELELSNLGPNAVTPRKNSRKIADAVYNGFRYFHDFQMDVLSWKLGGYIDDHTGATDQARRCGFLELAPGRLNIEGELSRPATADPWLLSQLIREIVDFYDVKPHSLHLSFQLRKNQIGNQRVLPLDFVKCLFVLGGGLEQKNSGRFWISRMGYEEITRRSYGEELVFARTSQRRWYMGEDEVADKAPPQAITHIQQYKFIRLEKRANYEPLIFCLKGLQLAYNPADYLTAEQLQNSPKLREEYEELKKWASDPAAIDEQTINKFVETVQAGLMDERHHRPAHKLHHIDWAVSIIGAQLYMFNEQLKKSAGPA